MREDIRLWPRRSGPGRVSSGMRKWSTLGRKASPRNSWPPTFSAGTPRSRSHGMKFLLVEGLYRPAVDRGLQEDMTAAYGDLFEDQVG